MTAQILKWINASNDEIRLWIGEATPKEIRTLKGVLSTIAANSEIVPEDEQVLKWSNASDKNIRLWLGKTTQQEIRTLKAVLNNIIDNSETST